MIAGFVAVLYSTFLTRSGVLGDTSVHSFVEPGFFVYVLLLAFLLLFLVLGIVLIAIRFRDMSSVAKRIGVFSLSSRELMLSIGTACILASAGIVLLGTSYPIFAELIGKPKAAVEPDFYNKLHLPLIAVLLLANGISLITVWSSTDPKKLLRDTFTSLVAAIALSAIAYAAGILPTLLAASIVAIALFALLVNIRHIVRLVRMRKPMALGAYLSHAGLAILIVGIIQLAYTSATEHLRLVEGKTSSWNGYTFSLLGKQQLDRHLPDREKYRFIIAVERDGKVSYAHPVVYYSDFNQRQAPFLEPGIVRHIDHDVYIAPKALDIEESSPALTLIKNSPIQIPLDTARSVTLLGFDMSQAQQSDIPGALKLGARFRVQLASGITVDTTLYTYFDGQTFVPKTIALDTLSFALVRIQRNQENPEQSTATLRISTPSAPSNQSRQVLVIDASIKPAINIVWIGFIVMLSGVMLSTVRAFRTQAKLPISSPEHTTAQVKQSLGASTAGTSHQELTPVGSDISPPTQNG
jgi:cytochrome c-type biogenesis protein CcmF